MHSMQNPKLDFLDGTMLTVDAENIEDWCEDTTKTKKFEVLEII